MKSDLRWTRGSNNGLGDVYAYDHAHGHYSNTRTSPWFSNKDAKWPNGGLHFSDESGSSNKVIQHIRNDFHNGKQHEWFALRRVEGYNNKLLEIRHSQRSHAQVINIMYDIS